MMSPDVWVLHGTDTSTEFGETFRQWCQQLFGFGESLDSGVNSCLDESYRSQWLQ